MPVASAIAPSVDPIAVNTVTAPSPASGEDFGQVLRSVRDATPGLGSAPAANADGQSRPAAAVGTVAQPATGSPTIAGGKALASPRMSASAQVPASTPTTGTASRIGLALAATGTPTTSVTAASAATPATGHAAVSAGTPARAGIDGGPATGAATAGTGSAAAGVPAQDAGTPLAVPPGAAAIPAGPATGPADSGADLPIPLQVGSFGRAGASAQSAAADNRPPGRSGPSTAGSSRVSHTSANHPQPADAQAADAQAADARAASAQAADVQVADVQAADVQAADVQRAAASDASSAAALAAQPVTSQEPGAAVLVAAAAQAAGSAGGEVARVSGRGAVLGNMPDASASFEPGNISAQGAAGAGRGAGSPSRLSVQTLNGKAAPAAGASGASAPSDAAERLDASEQNGVPAANKRLAAGTPEIAIPAAPAPASEHKIMLRPVETAADPAQPTAPPAASLEQAAPVVAPAVTATVTAPAASSQPHPATPAEQVAPALLTLAKTADGSQQMTVRLQPGDLGMVEVRIARAAAGTTQIDITADNPGTLLALQRDQPQLHRTLDEAGIPTAGRSVSFHAAAAVQAEASNNTSGSSGGHGSSQPGSSGGSFGRSHAGTSDADGSSGGRGGYTTRERSFYSASRQTSTTSGASRAAIAASTQSYRIGLDITA